MTRTTTRGEADTIPAGLFKQHMAELYWLAFLITADQELSVQAFADATEFDDFAPASSQYMVSWARKLVIVAALDAVDSELRHSKLRTQNSARNWDVPGNLPATAAMKQLPKLTKSDLEEALLAVDVFPRCAFLLILFEGLSVIDTSVLLDADRELVLTAQVQGAIELTHNLAKRSDDTWRTSHAIQSQNE